MPKVQIEGYISQEALQKNIDKFREIFDPCANFTINISADECFSSGYACFNTYDIEKVKKQPKRVEDFCREQRCWAAQNMDGTWFWYAKNDKPHCGSKHWSGGYAYRLFNDLVLPTHVSWDKSLVAPDGRLILVEGKKQKKKKEAKFKIGRWYKHKYTGKVIKYNDPSCSQYQTRKSDWYEMKHYKPQKKKVDTGLKRGEPIFVWDSCHDSKLPVVVKYFHSVCDDGGIFTCNEFFSNREGVGYLHYRKYDPELVGVPRKDWPKTSA